MTTCYICGTDHDDLMTHLDCHVLAIGQHHPPTTPKAERIAKACAKLVDLLARAGRPLEVTA